MKPRRIKDSFPQPQIEIPTVRTRVEIYSGNAVTVHRPTSFRVEGNVLIMEVRSTTRDARRITTTLPFLIEEDL